jgi:hypothetical protein
METVDWLVLPAKRRQKQSKQAKPKANWTSAASFAP